jgi:hypothetical protein
LPHPPVSYPHHFNDLSINIYEKSYLLNTHCL